MPVQLRAAITNAAGEEVWTHSDLIAPPRFTRHSADAKVAVPIATLAAGEYLLTIDATAEARTTEPRNVRFSVTR